MDAKNLNRYEIITNLVKRKLRKEFNEKVLKHFLKFWYKLKYNHISDVNKILYVDIDDISSWYQNSRYKEFTFPGQIKSGDWSLLKTPRQKVFENSNKYKSIGQRYIDGKPWSQTDLFKKKYKHFLQKGFKVKGCDNLKDLETHYVNTYDRLFESIRKDGILPPSEENPNIDPIYINVDKNGELLYTQDGNHRLFMCMVIGIKEIPVRVWSRHTEWQKKREQILSGSLNDIDEKYRQFLNHPDIVSELEQNDIN